MAVTTKAFRAGQRWVSETEPELGLGAVLRVSERTVTVVFAASDETREYALDNAPLRRVCFQCGDSVTLQRGGGGVVRGTRDGQGLIWYRIEGEGESEVGEVCETEIGGSTVFNKPQQRLLAGQVDSPESFDLRVEALGHEHRRRRSALRGFLGGRIDLIPHQLFIASEVTSRMAPRVLLADEVGLGKTIEACLILHRLILTGRVQRVLILVPESLVHQWFVELQRRFNLWFHIFDEARCAAIDAGNPGGNPFLDDQLVLTSIGFVSGHSTRAQQAMDAGWDMIIVDEAHHLEWATTGPSREYAIVEALGQRTDSLLLLTATPEQLGVESHFARLRLLDPDRFYDLERFVEETRHYRTVAGWVDLIQRGEALTGPDLDALSHLLTEPRAKLEALTQPGDRSRTLPLREQCVAALLDRHGTGRVMFRTTRKSVAGFPRRVVHLERCPCGEAGDATFARLADELDADMHPETRSAFIPDYSKDNRIDWLSNKLQVLPKEKVLVLCATQAKVLAIDAALRLRINLRQALFHEGLSLVQRDRNAAWFAETDGAQVLICSEIGGEGRNFQFAHHLVLFDLPLEPDLLEQRIGRLDRIGQTSEIQIHVPFVEGSPQEVLVRWYHEGLKAFDVTIQGVGALLSSFRARLFDLARDYHETRRVSYLEVDRLVLETGTAREDLMQRLEAGRDRLLELNSCRPQVGSALACEIREMDAEEALEDFMISVFDAYSIHVETLADHTYRLGSAGVFADVFPGLGSNGMTVTSDRVRALAREDIQFLTWDHPLTTGALDLLLGSERGNSSFGFWRDAKVSGLYFEVVFVLECVAPSTLHVDRFLPPTPIRILLDHRGDEVGELFSPSLFARCLREGSPYPLLDQPGLRDELLPRWIEIATQLATEQGLDLARKARQEMCGCLDQELARMQKLRCINPSVREEELELLREQRRFLDEHLTLSRVRVDALRLIRRGS